MRIDNTQRIGGAILLILASVLGCTVYPNIAGMELVDAAQKGNMREVRLLLHYGARPNYSDDGILPLINAVAENHIGVANLLLAHGADVNVQQDQAPFYTPLLAANRPEMVTFLLSKGADANANDVDGITALMIATENADVKSTEILVSHGADINLTDVSGQTALMKVAAMDYQPRDGDLYGTAKILLVHHADVTVQDYTGRTALAFAKENHHPEIVALLRKAGAKN